MKTFGVKVITILKPAMVHHRLDDSLPSDRIGPQTNSFWFTEEFVTHSTIVLHLILESS